MAYPPLSLCIICARGGSKRLPGKNVRLFLGKPLIAHTIIAAQRSKVFHKIAVSSDSLEILDIAQQYNADLIIKRPAVLATDESSSLDAFKHALLFAEQEANIQYDNFVALQPTSPLRRSIHIQEAYQLFFSNRPYNLFSVTLSGNTLGKNRIDCSKDGYIKYLGVSSRHGEAIYEINGAIYIWDRNRFIARQNVISENSRIYIMPKALSLDIDTVEDFQQAENMATKFGPLIS